MKKKKDEEKYKILCWILTLPIRIEAVFQRYPKNSTIPKFRRELKKVGFKYFKYDMDYAYFCQQYPKETRNIVLEYYDKSVEYLDKQIYLSCLSNKENLDLFNFMLDELILNGRLTLEESYTCELIAEIIYTTKNINYSDEYIKYVLANKMEYRMGRYANSFIKICGYYKIEEVHNHIRIELKYSHPRDRNIIWHALKNYNDKDDENLLKKFPLCYNEPEEQMDIVQLKLKDNQIVNGIYSEDSTIPTFINRIRNYCEYNNPIDIQNYCQTHSKKTRKIVMEFYKNAVIPTDQRYYLRCLDSEDNDDLYPFLINELKYHIKLSRDYNGIVISSGNYFSHVYDKKFKDKYIEIFLDETLPHDVRFYIFLSIISLQLSDIESYVIEKLTADEFPFVCLGIEYLSKSMHIEDFKEIFEKYKTHSDSEIRSTAKKTLKKIDNKNSQNKK